jgi:hypothetical protein
MVSFIGGLALQVKNKNGITLPLSWANFVGSEKSRIGFLDVFNPCGGRNLLPEGIVIL